jgi:hypothetical protein
MPPTLERFRLGCLRFEHLRSPTLAAKTKARRGWGTQCSVNTRIENAQLQKQERGESLP